MTTFPSSSRGKMPGGPPKRPPRPRPRPRKDIFPKTQKHTRTNPFLLHPHIPDNNYYKKKIFTAAKRFEELLSLPL